MSPDKSLTNTKKKSHLINLERFSWCLYDWAQTTYSANINSFILSVYFIHTIAINPNQGMTLWGYALGLSAFLVALLSPALGYRIDQNGNRGHWFIILTLLTITFTFLWWWVYPGSHHVVAFTLIICIIGNLCFELASMVYNSMLKNLSSEDSVGRLSGWAYALGYAGSLACLALCLIVFIKNSFNIPLLQHNYQNIRIIGPLTALWFLLFSLPSFFFINHENVKKTKPNDSSFLQLLTNTWLRIKKLAKNKTLLYFYLSRMFYIDGLNAIFVFAGPYAQTVFHLTAEQVLFFAICIQISALIGALIFAKLDDHIGPQLCLKISVSLLAITIGAIAVVHSVTLLWVFGLLLGATIGPIQSCSRSLMTHLSPLEDINKNFGLFSLSGKITAFLGPWLLAITLAITHNQRLGIIPILILVLIGPCLLFKFSTKNLDS